MLTQLQTQVLDLLKVRGLAVSIGRTEEIWHPSYDTPAWEGLSRPRSCHRYLQLSKEGRSMQRDFSPAPAETAAEESGPDRLYRWYDEDDRLLYVGISNEPATRALTHLRGSRWTDFAVRMELDPASFPDRPTALEAEAEAIRQERPIFNTIHAFASRAAQVRYLRERGVLPLDTEIPDETELMAALGELETYRIQRENLHSNVRKAAAHGASRSEIARVSGLSRLWVGRILNGTFDPASERGAQVADTSSFDH
jgi:hypothetical protein